MAHPSTNRARRRATSVIKTSVLPLRQPTVKAISTRSSADADNGLDAFSGQSRSTNIVPFHMLNIVSYCAIVTLSLRQNLKTKCFYDIRLQKMS